MSIRHDTAPDRTRLVLLDGEGHLGIYQHLSGARPLTAPDTADSPSTARP